MPPSLLSVYAADLPSVPTEPMAMQFASASFACRRRAMLYMVSALRLTYVSRISPHTRRYLPSSIA